MSCRTRKAAALAGSTTSPPTGTVSSAGSDGPPLILAIAASLSSHRQRCSCPKSAGRCANTVASQQCARAAARALLHSIHRSRRHRHGTPSAIASSSNEPSTSSAAVPTTAHAGTADAPVLRRRLRLGTRRCISRACCYNGRGPAALQLLRPACVRLQAPLLSSPAAGSLRLLLCWLRISRLVCHCTAHSTATAACACAALRRRTRRRSCRPRLGSSLRRGGPAGRPPSGPPGPTPDLTPHLTRLAASSRCSVPIQLE